MSDTASQTTAGEPETAAAEPMFRITAGNPSPEEVAALTVVLAAAASGESADTGSRRPTGWSRRARTMPGWASTSGWGNR